MYSTMAQSAMEDGRAHRSPKSRPYVHCSGKGQPCIDQLAEDMCEQRKQSLGKTHQVAYQESVGKPSTLVRKLPNGHPSIEPNGES